MSAQSSDASEAVRGRAAAAALEENRRLRRTMRDLVALSTLPAVWSGLGRHGLARSVSEVLLSTLSLDLVYVRVASGAGEVIEVVRSKHGDAARENAAKVALASLLANDVSDLPATIAEPLGSRSLRIAVVRFGIGGDHGALIACSANPRFPSDEDRLLLSVGANHVAIALQRREAEERMHEQQEWLRVTLASIADAVIATDT